MHRISPALLSLSDVRTPYSLVHYIADKSQSPESLEDVPLTTQYDFVRPQSSAQFNDIFNLAYQSGAVGYCFGNDEDHGATPALPDEKTRREYADLGVELINKLVDRFDMPHVVEQMRKLEAYGKENESKYPWMPAAWNDGHR